MQIGEETAVDTSLLKGAAAEWAAQEVPDNITWRNLKKFF